MDLLHGHLTPINLAVAAGARVVLRCPNAQESTVAQIQRVEDQMCHLWAQGHLSAGDHMEDGGPKGPWASWFRRDRHQCPAKWRFPAQQRLVALLPFSGEMDAVLLAII